jgi:hypothetical protein
MRSDRHVAAERTARGKLGDLCVSSLQTHRLLLSPDKLHRGCVDGARSLDLAGCNSTTSIGSAPGSGLGATVAPIVTAFSIFCRAEQLEALESYLAPDSLPINYLVFRTLPEAAPTYALRAYPFVATRAPFFVVACSAKAQHCSLEPRFDRARQHGQLKTTQGAYPLFLSGCA